MKNVIPAQAGIQTLTVLVVTATLILFGCSEPGIDTSESTVTDSQEQREGEDARVLATVNGEAITEADVAFTIERTFSNVEGVLINQSLQHKVLESLIASKAMQQQMQQTLPESELQDIAQKVKAFEEELFVKAYLQRNATPEPVTSQMVEQYYTDNPEEFSGVTVKTVELLTTAGKPSEQQRDKLLKNIAAIKKTDSWQRYARQNPDGLNLVYKRAKVQPGLLGKTLMQAVKKLQINEVSEVIFVDSVPTVLRVVAETQLPPKALAEVSADIRKKLAPMQLKKAVKAVSEQAVSNAEVEIY